jgi:hypothetical protein
MSSSSAALALSVVPLEAAAAAAAYKQQELFTSIQSFGTDIVKSKLQVQHCSHLYI